MTSTLPHQAPLLERKALSVREFIARIWPHCRTRKGAVAMIVAGCAIEVAFFWVVPLSFRSLIDNAIGPRDRQHLINIVSVLAIGIVVTSIASIQRGRLYARLQSQVVSDIRFQIFRKVQQLPVAFFSRTPSTEVLSRASGDLAAVDAALASSLSAGLMPAVDAIAGTVVLFVLDWRLALIASLMWPWCAFVPARLSPAAGDDSYERRRREARTLRVLQEAVDGHAVIRAYSLEEATGREFLVRDADLFTTSVRLHFLLALMDQAAMIGMLLVQVVVIGVGGWLAFAGSLTVGTLAAFQALCLSVSASLLAASQYSRDVLPARAGLRRIDEFLAQHERRSDSAGAVRAPALTTGIEFADVTFDRDGRTLLEEVSFRIPRGSFTGIVGPSGAGKSVLLSLLLRFDDPTRGVVRIDGVDLRALQQRPWRAQLGVVFQETFLFSATVRENIRVGQPDATDGVVEAAARAAEIHAVIVGLPAGYDTPIGAGGHQFSAGERQRLALARALVRDPAVLVLDEGGSALDSETDSAISTTLQRLAGRRTIVAVTHRLESVAHADQIVVMQKGRIVEVRRR